MTQTEVAAFISGLAEVQQEENFGYLFYFVGDDHMLPFVTIANSDSEYDNVSNLSRDGVFRINIGVKRETFEQLIGDFDSEKLDYSALDRLLPHPDYAKQNFVCILNPTGSNTDLTKRLIQEAHGLATERWRRKSQH